MKGTIRSAFREGAIRRVPSRLERDGAGHVRLEREHADALDLACQLSPDDDLLDDRRWLQESIRYRTPMIHPLNLIQIEVLTHRRLGVARELLFRETVTGIAAGMLTTG